MEQGALDVGLFLARAILGLGVAAHGAQKLFGWFGGPGLREMAGHLESMGFRPGGVFAALAGLAEFGGGALVAAGLLGPVGPALVVATLTVARVAHRGRGFFASGGGVELAVAYAAGISAFAFAGYGRYSLDGWLGTYALWTPARAWMTVVLGLAVGWILPMLRRSDASAATGS